MVVVLGLGARGGGGRSAAAEVLRPFGAAAATCVGVLAVTGLSLSSTVVGSVDAALLAVYGRVLVLQVTFVGVAALLGWHTTAAAPARCATARRSVVVESAVLSPWSA